MPEQVNLLAVVAAALSSFGVGALWYSPLLFGRQWMRENGFTEAQVDGFSKTRAFGSSLIFALVMALNLAFFLADEQTTVRWGVAAGALAGVGWVAMAIATIGVFENRSWTYIAINSGYQAVALTIMGLILGAWR